MKSLKQFIAMLPVLLFAGVTTAQDRSIILEEVLVTATKKAKGEALQDVAISATAFNENQLEALQFRDLQSLSYSIPNVSMDDVGTTKGFANFSFRGLGINSSIPSVDPTVGVFVDGVYLGISGGVIFDNFDIAGVEILRGPQGVLFGRNVTGGAVLLNTTNPSREFEGTAKASMESGDHKTYQVRLSGPIKEDKLLGKLAVYHADDGGYHKNLANGNDEFGKLTTTITRGAVTYFIGDEGNSDITLKYESGKSYGDGPASQNGGGPQPFDRHSFDFAVNEEGKTDAEWQMATATYTRDIGDGTLTSITGWRDYISETAGDIDGTQFLAFHSRSYADAEQLSTELRYNILLNDWIDFTAGFYYFTQDANYIEYRNVPAAGGEGTGGGEITSKTRGLFASADWRISDAVTITTGARFTKEEKDADIAEIVVAGVRCSVDNQKCDTFDFSDSDSWTNFSPKLGVQWFPNQTSQVYAVLTRGYRSGGYNLRDTDTNPGFDPGPYNEEEQDSLELGAKYTSEDGRTRANVAVFQNRIKDMQRELVGSGTFGPSQTIRNSADAEITGAEFEVLTQLDDHFILGLNGGYLDGDYTDVKIDLNNDTSVNGADEALALPRLAEVTYGTNLTWENRLDDGDFLMARVSFNHRDEAASTDDNVGVLNAADMVDAMVSLNTRNNMTFSLYGKNLKDEVTHGGDTPLSGGSSFRPLNKGKVLGASFQFDF